jgi:muconate cycloisomerase
MLEEGITQAASLNVALTTSNLFDYGHAYFSPLRLEADITNYSGLIYDGRIHAPAAPGLGIKIFDDILDRYVTGRSIVSKEGSLK